MEPTLEEELLTLVKDSLRITYSYLDGSLKELIAEGMEVINETCGKSDFTHSGIERKLLKAYCRYAFNDVPDLFEVNCQRDLLKLQIKNGRLRLNG